MAAPTLSAEDAVLKKVLSVLRADATLQTMLGDSAGERFREGLIPGSDSSIGDRFAALVLVAELPGTTTWRTSNPPSRGSTSRWLIQVTGEFSDIGEPAGASPAEARNRIEELLHGQRFTESGWTFAIYKIEAFRDTYEIEGRTFRGIGGYFEAYTGETG